LDFLKRLFGGSDEPPVANDATDEAVPASAAHAQDDTPADAVAMKSFMPSESVDVKWRNIAGETGHSSYAGEIDGVRVATVVKHDGTEAGREPWEWRLDVPTSGPAAGNARILRDAKPAVEQALVGWQH
jgi:hypothetical protein